MDISSMTEKAKFDEYLHLCNICKVETLTSRHMFPGYQAILVLGHVAQQEAYDRTQWDEHDTGFRRQLS